MRKFFVMCAALMLAVGSVVAADVLQLKDIADGKFAPQSPAVVTPMADGESYAMISEDGKKVLKFSYKTGRQTGVLFDAANTVGKSVHKADGNITSPDGTRMLI